MVRTHELFPDGTDYGRPNFVSLAKARALVADVVGLADIMDGDVYFPACERVATAAERMGAHSVARACRWLAMMPAVLDRHGYDRMHIYAEEIARRWLARQEARALSTGDGRPAA